MLARRFLDLLKRQTRFRALRSVCGGEDIAESRKRPKSWFWGILFDVIAGRYDVGGMSFEIPKDLTSLSFRGQFLWDSYESDERYLIDGFIDERDCVLELGGCLGVVACLTNKKLCRPQDHVVVEANSDLIPWLVKNRDSNECKFHVVHGMLSQSSDGTFFIHEEILDGSGLMRTDAGDEVVRVKVPVHTVDQVESKYGLKFNAAIVDIEGGELEFLEENLAFLSQVDLLIVEFHRLVIGDGIARATGILFERGLVNIENIGNSEVWVRASRLGIAAPRQIGPPTPVEGLPAIAMQKGYELAWDGVDGLHVRQISDEISPTQLHLVAAETHGRHRLGVRFKLPAGTGTYRLTAFVRPEISRRAYLELRDGSGANYGVAMYDLLAPSCIRRIGGLLDAGAVAAEDGWISIWAELSYAEASGAGYFGLASPSNDITYRGDGRSGLDFSHVAIERSEVSTN